MRGETWTVRIDGASRGNPGEAAYAVVIERPGQPAYEEADRLGQTTNNIAEYTALLRGLERAAELGGQRLDVFSDSELLVKQMNGEYRVKNADLKELHALATERLKQFERVTIRHVRRSENSRADALCNQALDGRPLPPAAAPSPSPCEQILACLRRAAADWAKGDPTRPDPEKVCEEILRLIEKN
jgi:ribonuclease HI